jgi:hypothetical protein
MKKDVILIIVLSFFVCVLGFAGEKPKTTPMKSVILTGKITDNKSNEFLAGVKISCSNCEKSFYTDLDGNFFIYLEVSSLETTKLEISQLGYSTKTLKLNELQSNSGNLIIDLVSE